MALVKPSGAISDIRGTIGGTVFSNSSAGLVMKTKTSPVNRNTVKQSVQRAIIGDLQSQWLSLTDDQRCCWGLYTKLFPKKQNNINGLLINAQQTFIKFNAPFRLYGIPIITDPVLTPSELTSLTYIVVVIAGTMSILSQRAMVATDEFIVLSMTYPKPPTVNNPGTTYKSIIFTTINGFAFDITTEYTDIFGRVPVSGENVFFKVRTIDKLIGNDFGFASGLVIFA